MDSFLLPYPAHFARQQLPRRTSLVQQTAATLKEWIDTGRVGGVLPGELQLKAQLGVGRDTLRQALKLLTREGWVESSVRGQQRRVQARHLASGGDSATKRGTVSFLSPRPSGAASLILEIEHAGIRLAERSQRLQILSPRLFHLHHPERALNRLVQRRPSAAWILHSANEAIQRWFERSGIPAFLCGLPFPGVDLPFVAFDWEGAAFRAGAQLIRKGHRVIGIMRSDEQDPSVLADERGLRRSFGDVGIRRGEVIVLRDDGTPASVAASLSSALSRKARATAIVVTRSAQLLTCYSWLASRGLRVPADVSVVCLAEEDWYAELYPVVCHYRGNPRMMAARVAQLATECLKGQLGSRKSVWVPLDYIPGATIGPAS